MSEFRKNPFTGEWTVYAKTRKNRPYEFQWRTVEHKDTESCPFCKGNEKRTTPAIYQNKEGENWDIRVFPNMFPIVSEEENISDSMDIVAGFGRHEVLVDTSVHEESIAYFTLPHMREVLDVLRNRYLAVRNLSGVSYVQIFKNCGPEAGMSIQHSHWQIVGIPVIPKRILTMAENGIQDHCCFCTFLQKEIHLKERLAMQNDSFAAVTPFASRYPYELWIFPKKHRASFSDLTEEEYTDLAEMLCLLLPKVASLRKNLGYNICLMDAPKGMDFHWHIQILPRIGGFAGFEHATDCYINTVLPETAAAYYRGENKPYEES